MPDGHRKLKRPAAWRSAGSADLPTSRRRPLRELGPQLGSRFQKIAQSHSKSGLLDLMGRNFVTPSTRTPREQFPGGSNWVQGLDLNQRPSGYEPDELPGCSTLQQKGGTTCHRLNLCQRVFLIRVWPPVCKTFIGVLKGGLQKTAPVHFTLYLPRASHAGVGKIPSGLHAQTPRACFQ